MDEWLLVAFALTYSHAWRSWYAILKLSWANLNLPIDSNIDLKWEFTMKNGIDVPVCTPILAINKSLGRWNEINLPVQVKGEVRLQMFYGPCSPEIQSAPRPMPHNLTNEKQLG
jgi:hypothetical protein